MEATSVVIHESRFMIHDCSLPARFPLRAAAESAATTAAAIAAAAAAAEAATTAAPSLLWARLVDVQTSSFEFLLIQRRARRTSGIVIRHFDERETARAAGGMVANQVHRFHSTVSREQLFEL